MSNFFKVRNGLFVSGPSNFTGAITGSISSAISASYALTASYALNGGGGGASVTISGSVPTDIVESGSLWFNQTDGNLYIQVSSPTGSTYVPATNTVAGGNYGATLTTAKTGSVWNINHNLNTTSPLVTIYSGSYVMIPEAIQSLDANNSRITFNTSVAGIAVLSTGIGNETIALAESSSYAVSASFATTANTANILTTRPTVEFRKELLGNLPLQTDLPILWDQTVLNIGTLIGSRLSYNINDNNGRFTNISGRTLTVQVDFQGCAVSQNGSMNLVEHNLFIVKNTNRIATFCTLPVGALFAIGRVNTVITLAPDEFFICYQYVTATGVTTWQTSDAYFGYTQGQSTRLKITEI